ncbi:terminase [Pandoraea sp. XJJ-1]|uniref:terminase small subunit-like protein n=1 Tax=Pandoraea sp. XJJ-1 TaxID=3002643 RepID=UPI00228195AD|nr:terminase [Pandoraea sp. XJJ-1]WAL81325.1 terminase [Pandoraea sp. XJJ-1]
MGRQSTFSQEVADAICERVAEGEPLRAICREEGMPAWRTVYHWTEDIPEFAAHIARARVMGREAIFEDTLIIADTPEEGVETETSENGVKERRGDMLGHRKLKIETRFKLLAKWDPKKYGERLHNEVTGADGAPLQQVIRLHMTPVEELPE